ncbi:MAG: hypothetical protein HN377_05085 [Alphaproteobacteria bacterium]|jgi:hypothetical protein|nr:hypothetical protein [Alphaproteobacteria bacterium]MBT7943321.1 hypothetical protein [Alphaproteobacteria bacterium]
MSGNIYEFRSEITQRDINAGIRRARELRSHYVANLLAGAVKKSIDVFSDILRRDPLSLSPTGDPSSAPAFRQGAGQGQEMPAIEKRAA